MTLRIKATFQASVKTLGVPLMFAALFIFSGIGDVRAADEWQLPDPASGNIKGYPAILFWPEDQETNKLLDPRDCQVRVTPKIGWGAKKYYFPCGEWFLPPVGSYVALDGK